MHDFRDHSYRKTATLFLFIINLRKTIWGYLGTARLLQPKTKQKMDFLPPSAPNLVFERETYIACLLVLYLFVMYDEAAYVRSERSVEWCTASWVRPCRDSQTSWMTGGDESTCTNTESVFVLPITSVALTHTRTESPSSLGMSNRICSL